MNNLVLLTGFLGAGKTTLMQNILNVYSEKKVGVIINEFGNVNIDAALVKRDGIEMAELSNGSIFCACIKDKFVDSLIELSGQDLEYIFIEASGLADPANMPQILSGIANKTIVPYNYRGAICVLDGESFLDLYDLLPAIHHQVVHSNGVILNKVDLIEEDYLESVKAKINEINSSAKIYPTSYCNVDIKKVIDEFGMVLSKGGESTNTVETRPNTFIVRAENPLPLENLKAFISDIVGSSFRIKGFADTDQGHMQVSTVGKNISFQPWEEPITKSELVIISSVGIRMMSEITAAIDKNLKGKLHL